MARFRHVAADAIRGIPGISLFSLELLVRRPRALARFQAQVARLRRAALGRGLPPIRPAELFPDAGEYALRFGEGGVDFDHLPDLLFAKVVAMLQPKVALEIGTHVGFSTRMMAMFGPEDIRIYTLDLPPDSPLRSDMTDPHLIEKSRAQLGSAFRGTRWEDRITQLLGDSLTFDFGPYRRSADLVYVDGSHSYPYVVSDTRAAMTVIRPGGVIIWDAYGSMRAEYGTTRYLERLRAAGYPVFQLGEDSNRAILRVSSDLIERFEQLHGDG